MHTRRHVSIKQLMCCCSGSSSDAEVPAFAEPGPFSSAPLTAAKPPKNPKTINALATLYAPGSVPSELIQTSCTATPVQSASMAVASQGSQLTVPNTAPANTSTIYSSEQHRLSPAGADTPSPAQADQLHTPTTGAATPAAKPAATPAATLTGAPAALSSPVRPMWAGHADTGAHHTAAGPRKPVVCTFIWGSAARAQRSARATQGTAVEFRPPASELPVGGANPLKVCASHSIPCTKCLLSWCTVFTACRRVQLCHCRCSKAEVSKCQCDMCRNPFHGIQMFRQRPLLNSSHGLYKLSLYRLCSNSGTRHVMPSRQVRSNHQMQTSWWRRQVDKQHSGLS